jgi:hypothetical protein
MLFLLALVLGSLEGYIPVPTSTHPLQPFRIKGVGF